MPYEGSPAQAFYNAADSDALRNALDENVEFRICPGWPGGGVFTGHRGVFEDFFPRASPAWRSIRAVPSQVFEVDDTFIVRGQYVGVASSGTPFEVDFVHIWGVHDGKLISLDQVADSATLAQARVE